MIFKKSDQLPDLQQWKSVVIKIKQSGCNRLQQEIDRFPGIEHHLTSSSIKIICCQQSSFPQKLKSFPVLFIKGKPITNSDKIIAVIGTRKCTASGVKLTKKISAKLAETGFRIVSDLSEGIARISQYEAWFAGGSNISVFPGRAGEYFPGSSYDLANRIAQQGTLIWLWPPLDKKTKLYKSDFQSANSVIASLADIIILIEAGIRSGTYSVIREGADLGKDILVWSTPRSCPQGDLPKELLNQGCTGFSDYPELMKILGISAGECKPEDINSPDDLTPEQQQILESLEQPMPISLLMEKTNFTIDKLLGILIELELNGFIRRITGGMLERI